MILVFHFLLLFPFSGLLTRKLSWTETDARSMAEKAFLPYRSPAKEIILHRSINYHCFSWYKQRFSMKEENAHPRFIRTAAGEGAGRNRKLSGIVPALRRYAS